MASRREGFTEVEDSRQWTVGGTIGKSHREVPVAQNIKNRAEFVQKFTPLTGTKQLDGILRTFDSQLFRSSGASCTSKTSAGSPIYQRVQPDKLTHSMSMVPKGHANRTRDVKFNTTRNLQGRGKIPGCVKRLFSAPVPSSLEICGTHFSQTLQGLRLSAHLGALPEEQISRSKSTDKWQTLPCSPAQRLFGDKPSGKPKQATQRRTEEPTDLQDLLFVKGIHHHSKSQTATEKLAKSCTVEKTSGTGLAEVTSRCCPAIRPVGLAHRCMPARVLVGSSKRASWSVEPDGALGRVQMFKCPTTR